MHANTDSSRVRAVIGTAVAFMALALFVYPAQGEVLGWDFDVHPSQETPPMIGYAGGALWDGGPTNTPYGEVVPGTGLQGDGTAIFADSPLESSNSGFVFGGWPGDFTVDLCVRVLEDVDAPGTDARAKSFSIRQANGNGRGVALNKENIRLKHGTGTACGPWPVDLASWYKIIRIGVNTLANTATLYVWDGSGWIELGSCGLGGSGYAGEIPPAGFAIGSLAGSSTQSGKFVIAWAYADTTQNLANTGEPLGPDIPTPPSCVEVLSGPVTQSVTGFPSGLDAPFASTNLGDPDVSNGMTHPSAGDGQTLPVVKAGRSCRRNVAVARDGYMYFRIDDALAFAGSAPAVTISFDYFDSGAGTFDLHYDGAASEWSTAATNVPITGTNTWKRGSFSVTDAWFANRQNNGADFRIARGGDLFYIDEVMVSRTGAHGPGVAPWQLSNTEGTADLVWDAVEANADGSPADYDWLSLSLNPLPGPLAPTTSALIQPVIDTTTLATPGVRTAYIKVTGNCSPAAYAEPFAYADGSLAGQGGWAGRTNGPDTPDYAEFTINAGELRLAGGGDPAYMHAVGHTYAALGGGLVSVKVDVKLGGTGETPGTFWDLRVTDPAGKQFAWWRGTPIDAHARKLLPGDPGTEPQALFSSTYKTMEMRIDTEAKTTAYYFDGALLTTLSCEAGVGTAVERVEFQRVQGAGTTSADYIVLDNLALEDLGYRLRRIDLNVVGCSYTVEPATALLSGGCAGGAQSFAVINNGSTVITSLAVDTVMTNSGPGWPHYDFPWLPLPTWPAEINLAPGESAEVQAAVDWSQMALGVPETALLKFNIPGCPDAAGETKLPLTALRTEVPSPSQFIAYDASKLPEEADSAGEGQQFSTYDTFPLDYSGRVWKIDDPEALDGVALHLDDGGADQTKFYSIPAANIVPSVGATVVARLKTESFTPPGDGARRSGNIWIWGPSISAQIFWGGPDGVLREGLRGGSIQLIGDANYHTIRVTSRDTGGPDGIVINVYFDEAPEPLLHLTNRTAVNSPAGVSGFGFGVVSGGDAQPIDFDCFTASDAGAFAPGEEVACIGHAMVCPTGPQCHTPFADVEPDGDVDQVDFAQLQRCWTGPDVLIQAVPGYDCNCLDQGDDDHDPLHRPDHDHDIDSRDLTAFTYCVSGPGVPWVSSVECP